MVENLHTFDLVIAGVVLISGVLAFMHGFVREVLSIATWIGAGAVAILGYPMAREVAAAYIPSPLVADIAAGALLFVGAFLVLAVVARAIGRAFESADGLGPINRSLGLMFGLFRGGLIVAVAYLALSWTVPERDHPGWIAEARTTPILKEGAAMIESALPAEWRRQGVEAAQTVEEGARGVDMYRRLTTPDPSAEPRPGDPGYNEAERKALDELIQGRQ